MILFKFCEAPTGAIHWVMANNEEEAKTIALHHANLPYSDYEHIIPDEMQRVEIGEKEELTFFANTNPITLDRGGWETVYEHIDEPFYLACSEF